MFDADTIQTLMDFAKDKREPSLMLGHWYGTIQSINLDE
jgi:hypothetical protein